MASKGSSVKLVALVLVLLLVLATIGVFGYLGAKRFFSDQQAETCSVTGQDGVIQTLSVEQTENASVVAAVTVERNMLPFAATVGLATIAVETEYQNLSYGDRDSLGLFQQRPSQGWGTKQQIKDPVYAANAFYNHLAAIENYQSESVGELAQRIQLSGYPDRYQKRADEAQRWADAFTSQTVASVSCVLSEERSPSADADADADADDLEYELQKDFGSAITVKKQDGALTVTASGNYTGADSLSMDEANHAVLTAVANWTVAHSNTYSLADVAFDGKMWSADKNIDRTFFEPAGWVEHDAGADSVSITL